MIIDLDLVFPAPLIPAVSTIATRLPDWTLEKKQTNYFLSSDRYVQNNELLDVCVRKLLSELRDMEALLGQASGKVRVGAYFSTSEYMYIPATLSVETIGLLSRLNLSIDMSFYPCSDDPDD
jgi:hypothetical protein